jgi:hypothetical protein
VVADGVSIAFGMGFTAKPSDAILDLADYVPGPFRILFSKRLCDSSVSVLHRQIEDSLVKVREVAGKRINADSECAGEEGAPSTVRLSLSALHDSISSGQFV